MLTLGTVKKLGSTGAACMSVFCWCVQRPQEIDGSGGGRGQKLKRSYKHTWDVVGLLALLGFFGDAEQRGRHAERFLVDDGERERQTLCQIR